MFVYCIRFMKYTNMNKEKSYDQDFRTNMPTLLLHEIGLQGPQPPPRHSDRAGAEAARRLPLLLHTRHSALT